MSSSFPCPKCGHKNTWVHESRPTEINGGYPAVRRRRICKGCDHRWTTWETIMAGAPLVQRLRSARTRLVNAKAAIEAALKVLDAEDVGAGVGAGEEEGTPL